MRRVRDTPRASRSRGPGSDRPGRAARSKRLGSVRAPYVLSAEIYDRFYSWKDYAGEARRVREVVRRYGPHPAHSLLDVGCGTGEHLRYLSRHFDVTGVDQNRRMLAVARRKLPRARWVPGRMQTFRLRDRFDVITCLFSAIGYARSESDLVRILRNFAEHLRPEGIVIVEPWLTPQIYRSGGVHLATFGTAEAPIVRMNTEGLRRGRSVMDMHYLVGAEGRVRHWVERHDMGLFDAPTMMQAFRRAGLRPQKLASRFTTRRGLYVGVKERTSSRRGTPRHRSRALRSAP